MNRSQYSPDRFCMKCRGKLIPLNPLMCPICDDRVPHSMKFLNNARIGKNSLLRWVSTGILTLFFWQIIGGIPLMSVCDILNNQSAWGYSCDLNSSTPSIKGPSFAPNFLLLHLVFVIGLFGFWLLSNTIQKKPLAKIITGRKRIDAERIVFAMLIAFIFYSVGLSAELIISNSNNIPLAIKYQGFSFDWGLLLVLAVLLVPIQAGLEEIIFRGYLLHALSLLVNNRVFLALSTASIFSVVHLSNPEPWNYGIGPYLLAIFMMGFFLSTITLIDGGMELAMGLHIANNLWVHLVVGLENSVINTPSLFLITTSNIQYESIFLPSLIQFSIMFVVFGLKYKWFNFNKSSKSISPASLI
ncbi:MAG: hypothetical protein CL750_04990 [Chloroflexi bacterium]|nr:hypothetical protein [Chloroflexota bacterium]